MRTGLWLERKYKTKYSIGSRVLSLLFFYNTQYTNNMFGTLLMVERAP